MYHEKGLINLEDLNFETRKYSGWDAYYQSKLAQVLYTKYQGKLLEKFNVTAVSIHPGWMQTPLIKHTMPVFFQDYLFKPFFKMAGMVDPWLGSQTSLHCLLDETVADNSGCFYSQVGIYKEKKDEEGGWPMQSPNFQVYDEEMYKNLYIKSTKLVGLHI